MGRLAQTEGLTDVQQEILSAVHDFVENEDHPQRPAVSSTLTSTPPRSSRA